MFSALYDIRNRPLQQVYPNGVLATNTFDNADRVTSRTLPDGGVEQFLFVTNFYSISAHVNPLSQTNYFGYDDAERLTSQTNANNEVVRFGYNSAYDLTSLVDANNRTNLWKFDQFGRVTNKTDAAGVVTFTNTFDANNRLVTRYTPAKGTITYTHDAEGNLTYVNHPNSADISMAYDALNRMTNMVDAVGTSQFTYTSFGAMESEDGPWAADTITFGYTNRLRSSLTLAQASGQSWVQNYGYDSGRRTKTISSPAGTFTYDYLNAGRQVKKLQLPNGAFITNAFDSVARIQSTQLKSSGLAILNSHVYGYNTWHQRTNHLRFDGSYVDYTYDNIGQLRTASGKETNGTPLRVHEQLSYVYDPAGNLTTRTNFALKQTFGFNALNQMTSATRTGTLTVAGITEGPATSVTVNTSNAVLYADKTFASTNQPIGTNTFTAIAQDSGGNKATNVVAVTFPSTVSPTYDANGNTTNQAGRSFSYDDENQLTSITATNAWKSEFAYDGFGRRRVRKEFTWQSGGWMQTNEVRYVYDGWTVIQERDERNVGMVSYMRGVDLSGGRQGAGGIGGLLARTDGNGTAYYHTDGNGNVTSLISTNQALVATYLYDPFGNILAKSGSLADANLYRFSSKEIHQASGLIYYGFRFYEPGKQRWLTRDPLEEDGGINLYCFVENSPVDYTDSDGLAPGPRPGGGVRPGIRRGARELRRGEYEEIQRERAEAAERERLIREQFPGHRPGDTYLSAQPGGQPRPIVVRVPMPLPPGGNPFRFGLGQCPPPTPPGAVGRVEPTSVVPGTTRFGNEMHDLIAKWLEMRYPGVRFRMQVKPGQTGVDVTVESGNPGFKFAEIKPRNPQQMQKYESQVENWGYKPSEVQPITYDYYGNIYFGF